MLIFLHRIVIWMACIGSMTQSSLAQGSPSPHEFVPNLLQQTRIDDITEDPASRLLPDGQSAPGLLITCHGSSPERIYLAVQDYALKTDDRLVVDVEPGFCDAVLALARQRQAAQRR